MGQHHNNNERVIKTIHKEKQTERRSNERRKLNSEGYTYIQIVGWIDRREMNRRISDTFTI